MSFAVFRKYEKPLLAAAVVFTVAVFAFFPSFGDLSSAVGGGASQADLLGTFTVATTGERFDVSYLDFNRAQQSLFRFEGGPTRELSEADVWAHLMLLEDARGAGLRVTNTEIGQALLESFPEGQLTPEVYTFLWRDRMQFASARAFEEFFRDRLMVQRWREALESDARVVDADAIYSRWKLDNEQFDLDVLVFADAEPDTIADPGDETLQAWYDEMPEYLRSRRFVDPATYDLAVAWVSLDTDSSLLPAERLASLDPVEDLEVESRFDLLKAGRFEGMEELDDATREVLRNELVLIELATAAHQEWVTEGNKPLEGPVPDDYVAPPRTAADFVDFMAGWGLTADDPQGLMGPDELEALPEVGSPNLAARLLNTQVGDSRYFRPYGDEDQAVILFVEGTEPETPLGFAEARDQVLDAWRGDPKQVAAAANDFREALRDRARLEQEAADVLSEFEALAAEAAEARIAAAPTEGEGVLDEDAMQAIRDEELEIVQAQIDTRLAPFEHRAWDELAQASLDSGGATERVAFGEVPKSWRANNTDPDIDRTTLEYYVKSNGRVFQLGEDSLSDVLRHVTGKQSAVVRVTSRAFPDMPTMFADEDGMETARQRLAAVGATEAMLATLPDRLQAPRSEANPWGHGLLVAAPPTAEAGEGEAEDADVEVDEHAGHDHEGDQQSSGL
jgi:hypothetical protein